MAFQAHSPVGAFGVAPQTQARAADISTGGIYSLPAVPDPGYPSFRGYGALGAPPAAPTQLADALKYIAAAAVGRKYGEVPSWVWEAPSNEIGMEIRKAIIASVASADLYAKGAKGPSQRLYNEAKASGSKAAAWVKARVSASGQFKDSGKVETPAAIAARSDALAKLLHQWATAKHVPQLQALAGKMKQAYTPKAIAARQEAVGEKPGSPMTTLVAGAAILALIAFAATR
jgi:hypothetical protein